MNVKAKYSRQDMFSLGGPVVVASPHLGISLPVSSPVAANPTYEIRTTEQAMGNLIDGTQQ